MHRINLGWMWLQWFMPPSNYLRNHGRRFVALFLLHFQKRKPESPNSRWPTPYRSTEPNDRHIRGRGKGAEFTVTSPHLLCTGFQGNRPSGVHRAAVIQAPDSLTVWPRTHPTTHMRNPFSHYHEFEWEKSFGEGVFFWGWCFLFFFEPFPDVCVFGWLRIGVLERIEKINWDWARKWKI